MAQSRLAYITFLDGEGGHPDNSLPGLGRPVDPGYGQGGGGNYPSTGPVWGGRPDNSLPWVPPPGHIVTLPVFPFDPTKPDNELPGSGGGRPDNSLPGQIRPGAKFVVKWLACHGFILVPDNSLPSGSGEIDNELPEHPEPK